MAIKRPKPEEIVVKLRQVEVLMGQGIDHSCSASQFYNAYRTWCLTVGKKPKTTTAFKKSLDQIPSVYQKRTSSGQCWFGIRPCFVG